MDSSTGDDLAEGADEAERGDDGRHREQQRDAGGEQRAERDQQDDQRQRQRERARLLQVAPGRSLEVLLRAAVAELLDDEVSGWARCVGFRCSRRSRRRSLRRRVGVRVAGDVEGDHRDVLVVGDGARCPWRTGPATLWTPSVAFSCSTASGRPARNPGESASIALLEIRTASLSASREGVVDELGGGAGVADAGFLCVSCFVPTLPPIMNARTTNASQPTIAVFQWRALQRPARAARLREGCMTCPPSVVIRGGSSEEVG